MSLRQDNKIVILLGAGASYKAGIPTSPKMIESLEQLLKTDKKWREYQKLYYYVKSSIYYGNGIDGKFDNDVNYNIEVLVNTLTELARKTDHTLYPFIGNWNTKLSELAGRNFQNIDSLRNLILDALQKKWILQDDYSKSSYYQGLFRFTSEYNYTLRSFSLNYDLCVEENAKVTNARLERGFGRETGNLNTWDWKNFDENDEKVDLYLYKLHGSIDWKEGKEGKGLEATAHPGRLSPDEVKIIFGTNYKLQYVDPFLYFVYEFRRWTLNAKLIIAIGYGFGDEHINGIISQALKKAQPDDRKLLVVAPFKSQAKSNVEKQLAKVLDLKEANQIIVKSIGAEIFMERMSMESLVRCFPNEKPAFREI